MEHDGTESQEVLNPTSSAADIVIIDKGQDPNFTDDKYSLDFEDFEGINSSNHEQLQKSGIVQAEGDIVDRDSAPQNLKVKVIVLDNSTGREVELCSNCSSHVNSLQHDDVNYSIKFEEHYIDDEEIRPNDSNLEIKQDSEKKSGLNNLESNKGKVPRYIPKRGSTVSIPRQMALSMNLSQHLKPVEIRESSQVQTRISDQLGGRMQRGEFVPLEEKLLQIEIDLQKINQEEQPRAFKRLCDLAILCEDKWSRLYCEQKNIDFESNREKSLQMLKQNLDLRRENFGHMAKIGHDKRKSSHLREYKYNQRMLGARMNGGVGVSPYYNNKMCYGVCSNINSITEGPDYFYSPFIEDPCLELENQLFELESRLKKMLERGEATLESEYPMLMDRAQHLRDEWKYRFDQMKRQKSKNGMIQPEQMKNYDIQKCVVLSKQARRSVLNQEGNVDEQHQEEEDTAETV